MSGVFWVQNNGRWMIATSKDFVLPSDRIVEVFTKKQGMKRLRLATEPSCESFDKYGNPILIWGMSDVATEHGTRVHRKSNRKGVMK